MFLNPFLIFLILSGNQVTLEKTTLREDCVMKIKEISKAMQDDYHHFDVGIGSDSRKAKKILKKIVAHKIRRAIKEDFRQLIAAENEA